MNPLDQAVSNYIEMLRDTRRPTLELVLEVIESAFASFSIAATKVHDGAADGSGMWMWEDAEMGKNMLPKFYILSTSTAPGMEGYPLFTIRQAYSTKLDTWITMSSLVPGPGVEGISRTLALLIAQHAGAFAGVKYTTAAAAANGGSPHAGILAVKRLIEAEAPVFDPDDQQELLDMLEESKPPTGDLN